MTRKLHLWAIVLLLTVAACAPAQPPPELTPSPVPLTGTVSLHGPGDGALIFSEVLHLSGTATDLPPDGFLLRVTAAEQPPLAQMVVRPQDEAWSFDLLLDRPDEPTEVTITALSVDARTVGEYDTMSAVLSPLANRPDGAYGTITAPMADDVVGGDVIEVSGRISGLPDQTLWVMLRDDDAVIAEVPLTLAHPYALDEVPWQLDLPTGGVSGPVTLVLAYALPDDDQRITLHEVPLMLSLAAG